MKKLRLRRKLWWPKLPTHQVHWEQQVLDAVVTAGFCAVNHGSWEEPCLLCPVLG